MKTQNENWTCPTCGRRAKLEAIANDLLLCRITPEEAEQQSGIPLSGWAHLVHEATSTWRKIERASAFHKLPYYAQLRKCVEQGKELRFPAEWNGEDCKAYIHHWVWAWMNREPAPPPNRFYTLGMFQSIDFVQSRGYGFDMQGLVDWDVDRVTAIFGYSMFLSDASVILQTELLGEVRDAS
jgi:hypothetical protein